MHFSIPETQEQQDANGTAFTTFNIHINGMFHCSVRYSVLHTFHEQLKKEFGANQLPHFPPKKLFPLSPLKLDERRILLEKFVQIVSQDPKIANSDVFNGFLLSAQQETQKEASEDVVLDVYLMNGHKITVNIKSTDQTDDVLEAVASQIDLPDDYVYYFGLFLVQKEVAGDNSIVRKLQEFESPFISLKYANKSGTHRIVFRKSFWDLSYEDDLLENKISMNLLYVQAVNDIERHWTLGSKEQLKHLSSLQSKGSKREYLRLARTLKYYGHLQFKPCVTDYPHPSSRAVISVGNKEMNFRIQTAPNVIKEGNFRITRMRCWRITTCLSDSKEEIRNPSSPRLELAFEYLMAKDTLKWITITSDQAILMSMCLQSVVDELIRKKQGKKIKRPQDRNKTVSAIRPLQRGDSYAGALSRQTSLPSPIEETPKSNGQSVIENNAFDTIGDDDL
ncbi:sorting nexin-17-like [Pecten maximus]|uniref:sorting nexin-17-like n=1 Tax=Pecten maximus TaxID=6579 RepID=UPI001458506C|nr:sorting nexin-17-like [Pecten maximus]